MSKNLDMDKTKTIKINGLMISLGGRSELLLPAYDPQGIMARSILSMV
jgi:hypothetical protein